MTTTLNPTSPVVLFSGSSDPAAPLVVLLHGRGSRENDIIGLADALPPGPAYAAVRAPISEGGGFAWFANRGIGRPIAASLAATMQWFTTWLDEVAPVGRPVILIGFSGGAAFAGGLILDHPDRFAGAAILYGTLPFEAGVPTSPARLASMPVFVAQGDADHVIPRELLDRTWSYLHGESGAAAYSHRDGAGHGLSEAGLGHLFTWLRGRLAYLDRTGAHRVGAGEDATWAGLPEGRLPVRHGEAPDVSTTTPQQQLSQTAPVALQERVFEHVSALAGVQTRQSVISVPGARGFMIDAATATGPAEHFIVPQVGEFAHLHPDYDGSLHVALPQHLAADAIAKGWAVTHPLAGMHVTPGMVLLFGPRDEAELGVITGILDTAYTHATTQGGS